MGGHAIWRHRGWSLSSRILLLGKNGQVGWELQRALAPLGQLTALDRSGSEGLCGDLADLDGQALIGRLIRARAGLARRHGGWEDEFAFVMVDGLSIREDELTAALGPGLGPVPLFGGSAGDGTRFEATFVLQDGRFRQGWAVLLLVRTACKVRVFSLNHLTPTEQRLERLFKTDAQFDAGDYTASLQTLAALRAPVDAFFDGVMVNAEQADLRANRQGLLKTLHQAMNRVADLSRLA